MTQTAKPETITVNVDGRDVAVPKGTNVIEAARLAGVDIPHFCYHPKLTVVGNCRMCLIEIGMPAVDPATKTPITDPATGKPKVNWMPRPAIGCATNAAPGLHVRTTTPLVKDCRQGVMEFLLVNHPLDCPICDQAGECMLQEQATGYGRGYSRYIEDKNVKPKRTQLGPRVTLDDERCILCSRCIRFCNEVAKDDVLGFVDRGSHSTLACYPGRELANNYSLNTVDICPVGALTSTDFRFKMRVWFLKQTPGIDAESSVGANTTVWSREGVVYRITPRRNDDVNDTWMSDSGRELYKQVRAENRLAQTSLEDALAKAAELLKGGSVAIVASGRASVEEQFAARKLAQALGAATPVALVSRVGKGDGILISADRNPNVRGALITGLIRELPGASLDALAAAIDAGKVKTVVSIGEDVAAAGLSPQQLAKVSIIYLGAHADATSASAAVVLAGRTHFEKSGTFINQQFRIQKFAAAVPGNPATEDDLVLLSKLIAAAGASLPPAIGPLWGVMASEVPALKGLSYASLPETGQALEAGPFAHLPYVEGDTLHFRRPVPKPAEAGPKSS